METVSIIPSDNAVYVNGELRLVDCSNVDPAIHAIQWAHCPKRNKSKGHIEWVQDPLEDRKPNTPLESFEDYQHLVDAWDEAPTEEARHRRIRADEMVTAAETDLARATAVLAERKKQRDDLYAGRLDQVKDSAAL